MMNDKRPKEQIAYSTILGPSACQPHQDSLPASHPLFYCQNRHNYLSNLSEKYGTQSRLPTIDLKRNIRVDYYMGKYAKAKKQIDRQERVEKCYLRSDDFQTIFSQQIDRNRSQVRHEKQLQNLKQEMENLYLQQQINHEEPERDCPVEQQPYETVFGETEEEMGKADQYEQLSLRKIDLELGRLQFEEKINRQVENQHVMCQNEELMSKMSKNIVSAYMVNFDEIYNLLIDELLREEVIFLNYMEAQYKMAQTQTQQNQPEYRVHYENAKTLQMMELVKALDCLGADEESPGNY